MSQIRILIHSLEKEIRETCKNIENILTNWNLPKSLIFDTVLVIDEILSNILEHGKTDCNSREKIVNIEIIKLKHFLKIIVIDNCDPFQLELKDSMNISEYIKKNKTGGFGLLIINKLMDTIKLERKWDKNLLIITKKIENTEEEINKILSSKTTNAYIRDEILWVITKSGSSIELDDAIKDFEAYDRVIEKYPEKKAYAMIVDTRNMKMISQDAKNYYVSQKSYGLRAIAIIINSTFGKWMGNYFISLNKNKAKSIKLFNSEKDALFWVESKKELVSIEKLCN